MIPIKTSVDDIQKVVGYLGRQVGWVETSKAQKALGALDERKISAMVEFGLLIRDGGNLKVTPRGQLFNSGDRIGALREVLRDVELYRATLEWAHYGSKSEITATEVGQYWESSHADTLGNRSGSTLKDGAVCFGRIVDGAGLGTLTLGRGGRETRLSLNALEIDTVVNGQHGAGSDSAERGGADDGTSETASSSAGMAQSPPPDAQGVQSTNVRVATSPSVHVNVEIHIAADATADTVREIFRNMAKYVLERPTVDESD